METANLPYLLLDTAPARERGPGLGFFKLPPATVVTMETICSSLDLARQARQHRQPLVGEYQVDALAGVVDEWTAPPVQHGEGTLIEFHTLLCSGVLHGHGEEAGYDLLRFRPGDVGRPISSFGGVSGGGVWRLGLRQAGDGSMEVSDR